MRELRRILLEKYYDLRAVAGLFRNDLASGARIELHDRVKLLLNGYTSDKYVLYDMKRYSKNDFLSDWVHQRTRFINGQYSIVLNDKLLSTQILSPYVKMPDIYAVIIDGELVSLGEAGSRTDGNGLGYLWDLLNRRNRLVLKPIGEAGGRGVQVISGNVEDIQVNGKLVSREHFERTVQHLDRYLITEFIENGEYASNLYSDSLNTIRILTMIDPRNNEPFIAMAIQRIGTEATKPIDNFKGGKGGLNSKIDLSTGTLGPALSLSSDGVVWHERHPDSGGVIQGVQIPRWKELIGVLFDILRRIPYLKYVGWDIVVGKNEFVVIEINNHCGYRALQVHEPLLLNPRIRDFYEYYGIVGNGSYLRSRGL